MHPSIYRLRLQDILTFCVLSLLCLGVVMVHSAAMNVSGSISWHLNNPSMRHVVFAGIALLTFFAVGFLNVSALARATPWRSPVLWMYGVAALACILVLVPGVGREVNGARRWLSLGFTQVQPSELGKWAVVLFLAWWFSTRPEFVRTFRGFVLTMIPVGFICLLVVKEDFGTAALIGLCALALCLAGRVRLWHLAVAVPPALAGGLWFVMSEPYRWKRITAFADPYAAPQAEGYHMIQSLLSFATGGLSGTGLGRGVQKLGYLPEDTTDFIFAVICEEMGVFGALLVIALYLGILFVAWQAIRSRKDPFSQLLAFGVGSMIGLQALINIAVATVSVPPKGLSLPLISAGGSGLIITSAALGLLYSICRHQGSDETEIQPSTRGPIIPSLAAAE